MVGSLTVVVLSVLLGAVIASLIGFLLCGIRSRETRGLYIRCLWSVRLGPLRISASTSSKPRNLGSGKNWKSWVLSGDGQPPEDGQEMDVYVSDRAWLEAEGYLRTVVGQDGGKAPGISST